MCRGVNVHIVTTRVQVLARAISFIFSPENQKIEVHQRERKRAREKTFIETIGKGYTKKKLWETDGRPIPVSRVLWLPSPEFFFYQPRLFTGMIDVIQYIEPVLT